MQKNNQNGEVERISNTVPVDLKKRPKKELQTQSYQWIEAISKNERKKRVLIDWFSASLSPLISPSKWTLVRDEYGALLKVPCDVDPDPEIVGQYRDANDDFKLKRLIRYGNLKLLNPDEFFDWFFTQFDFLQVDKNADGKFKFEEFGGGQGFNAGRSYVLFGTDKEKDSVVKPAKINFKLFDPTKSDKESESYRSKSAYTDNGLDTNYLRQKISMQLSGNALQALRENGVFMSFMKTLYKCFRDPVVTRFDATLDLFNYGFQPKYFAGLSEQNKYLGRSRLNVVGDVFNPSVYIGAFKSSRTIMMYDKVAENKDKNESDEPDLLEAVKSNPENTWLRCEQVFTRHEDEADQAFEELLGNIWNEPEHKVWNAPSKDYSEFISRLGAFLKTTFDAKCRFLKKPRGLKNNERIGTDKKWGMILEALSRAESGFTFHRPKLTLEERKNNFMYRSLGGPNLFADIVEAEGHDGLNLFFEMVTEHVDEILENRENDEQN